ncbi:MAG: restriction endonuclease subunit S [Nitrosomonas sp.]|uniref:restriction endonuclease subunit S n=1 Tax=Nitrosomonas sp. TaxID=42353 RepID=UPI00276CFD0C|nr:restriction endonuclease subunit S [Nitrosomonas sp.]MDP3608655.1 restriction endonuclease subunit S [Methylophilus sp.]MDZ4107781.1 restriction endonuclease subunit S [Nitrosomonas sp.]
MKEWQYYKLDELGTVRRGRSRHRPRNAPHLYGGKYPFVQTADIKAANLYLTSYTQTYSEAGLAQSKLWEPGTLCITIAANIADTAILGIPACFPDSVIGFIPYEGKSDARYIKYCFNIFQKTFQQISQGATQDNLSAEKLLSMKIPVPPLPIQQKIAGILSAYDDLIENNLKRIKLLEEMAQIIYEEWFVRMRFPSYESASVNPETGLPEGWSVTNINDLYRIKYGRNLPQTAICEFGKFPVYGASGVMGYYHKCNADKKIALITSRGNGSADVHRTYEPAFITNNSFLVIPNQDYYYLSLAFTLNLLKLAGLKNYCSGAAQPQLTNDAIKGLCVKLPGKELVEKFNKATMPSLEISDNLRTQNQRLSEARDILLPRLMTGMIDVDQYDPSELLKYVA